jgi:Flp pilus assembly CpaF family ATPase
MLAKKSCIICGGIGAGKTTLLRAMAADIPSTERLITIEDSLELGLDRFPDLHPDVVALEAREPNLEGEGEVSMAELVRWALRMSPDRVIVGEARGEEVLALLNAMSQGTDGSMATLHASSSRGAFSKLATYAVQAPERLPIEATNLLVANAVHFVIYLAQDGDRRFVSSVREVIDAEGAMLISNEVFRPGPDRRAVPGAPFRTETLDELIAVGFDPALLERPEGWWDQGIEDQGTRPFGSRKLSSRKLNSREQ